MSALGIACLCVLYRQTVPQKKTPKTAPELPIATQQMPAPQTQHSTGLQAGASQSVFTQPITLQSSSTALHPAIKLPSVVPPEQFPRPVRTVLEAQVALVRLGISPGLIDGMFGPQTAAALAVYQRNRNLPVTGRLDQPTRTTLVLAKPALTNYVVSSNDLARLQPVSTTWLGKSRQSALEYESILELVAEKTFSHPNIVRRLNPQIDWANVAQDTVLTVPNVSHPTNSGKAAFIRISLSAKALQAFDGATNLVVHFPCSIARHAQKRPVGELHVTSIVPNPNYTFDPANFPESAEAKQLSQKLILPPGPNNPVGVAWIGLDKPGYGIHGTPAPERVGQSESHGCFRLANWNAEYLLKLVWIGMPVYVEP